MYKIRIKYVFTYKLSKNYFLFTYFVRYFQKFNYICNITKANFKI